MPHYGYWMGDASGPWMVFHAAFWLLFVAALLGVFFIPSKRGSRTQRGSSDALDLLDQRYAKGEIDREEYLQRKHDIVQGSRVTPPSKG